MKDPDGGHYTVFTVGRHRFRRRSLPTSSAIPAPLRRTNAECWGEDGIDEKVYLFA